MPESHRLPLAVIGTGGIMENAHLPAYRKAGLQIAGAFDRDVEKARAFAARHGIERVYDSLDALVADSRVAVVDVAITPWDQPALVERLFAGGKHVLAQKPLAPDSATALRIVENAERAERKLAVNQQLRFDEGIAAARAMVAGGWIGTPLMLEMTVDIFIEWTPWINDFERVQLWYHAIHELDAIRSILGDPSRVWCAGAKRPGQKPRGETRVIVGMVFPGELRAMVHVNSENLTGDPTATFRIDGAEGTIRGRLGRFYGAGAPDTLEVWSRKLPTDGWLPYPCTQRWFPDAFIGPMRSLLEAIATGGEPFTSGRDNVKTIRLIEALYRSLESGEATSP
ncbi:MAG: Gfo/Idh/MocA family oxidoreductase [Candidatus Eremiobacteraeota bacterium]|nr:Gfo/Idh/MocA family oxidoreductase [Candidatus Eremiobacteraeota bacterium]